MSPPNFLLRRESCERVEVAAETTSANSPLWARAIRLVVLLLVAAACVLSWADSGRSWAARRVLVKAAELAANLTVATPLSVKDCRDATPCPVQRAATAAKQYLVQAGMRQAECINPSQPTFSGVLVWVFSCDGSTFCDVKHSAVCIKVDMTATQRGTNGELIPFTQVTVQRPQVSFVASVLKLFPGKTAGAFPRSVSASALVRNGSVL